ncbi:MAG: hypothetical protein D6732_03990 [Methanobacteriota archaeon]|nr:MAG: hypothetical protein D6732_03990 [Euryarchaeota archaeon]
MTKYCNTCGTANDDNGRFCVSCGAKLEESISTPMKPAAEGTAVTPSPTEGQYPQQGGQYPPPNQYPATPQGGSAPPYIQGQYPPPQQGGQYPPPQQGGQYPAPQYPQGQFPAQQFGGYNTGMEKNGAVAFILSFFLPGFGHIYVGKVGMGLLIFILTIVLSWTIIVPLILWLVGMIDSVNKVGAYNNFVRRYGRPPQNYEF